MMEHGSYYGHMMCMCWKVDAERAVKGGRQNHSVLSVSDGSGGFDRQPDEIGKSERSGV
jgi:hypothetical protein